MAVRALLAGLAALTTIAAAEASPYPSKEAALAAGDWREAARQGASAAEVVRALQANHRFASVDPAAAVVSIGAAGDILDIYELAPLPTLDPSLSGRTASLGGFGDGFGQPPGTITLRPPYAESYAPASRR